MKADILQSVLAEQVERAGAEKKGDCFHFPAELPITFYVSMGRELVQIAKVRHAWVRKELVVVETHKDETFYLPYDLVEGIKVEGKQESPKKTAGFR